MRLLALVAVLAEACSTARADTLPATQRHLLIARAHAIPNRINAQSFDALDWPISLIFRPLFRDARFVHLPFESVLGSVGGVAGDQPDA